MLSKSIRKIISYRLFHPAIDETLKIPKSAGRYVSVNSNWVHPPGNPRGLAQKTCPGGRDLSFESCWGAGNLTRTGILWKIKVKLQKHSVDQIFTGENKKNKLNF